MGYIIEYTSDNEAQIKDFSYLIRYVYGLPTTNDYLATYIQYSSFDIPYTNYYISRVTQDFDTLWTTNFGDPLSDVLFFPNALVANENDIWLAYISCNNCGNYLYEESQHTINLKRITHSGAVIGDYFINGDYNYGFLSAYPSSDNGIYIIASLYNWYMPTNDLDIVVFKLDSLGNVISSVDDFEITRDQINVFPNPASDYLQFHSELLTDDFQIVLYRIDGSKQIEQSSTYYDTRVDISQLPVGMYIYQLINAKGIFQSGKFIKE